MSWLRSRSGRMPIVFFCIIVVVPLAVMFGMIFARMVSAPAQQQTDAANETLVRAIGLRTPVTNRLDPRYKDADGDLVADPPADVKDQIDPPTIKFSYIATETPEAYQKSFKEFTAYLSKVTGKPVEYVQFTSTEDELKALQEGKLHVAGLNTGSVPIAVAACGFVPVATLGDEKGKSLQHTEIIVPAGSPIADIYGLRGQELTLTEVGSNSGYKAPLVLLENEQGLLPGKDYTLRYSHGHEASIKGIANKEYAAAAVGSDILQRAIGAGTIKSGDFRVVYKSESFPAAGFGYICTLKPELAAKIKQALLDFDWKDTGLEKEFAPSNQTRFVPVSYKEDWALVRQIDNRIGAAYQLK